MFHFEIIHLDFFYAAAKRATHLARKPTPHSIMSSPINISTSGAERKVSYSLSVSPTTTFHSPPTSQSFMASSLSHRAAPKHLKPFNTEDIKILLLENVNQTGQDILKGQGYQVEFQKASLPEDQLIEKIR